MHELRACVCVRVVGIGRVVMQGVGWAVSDACAARAGHARGFALGHAPSTRGLSLGQRAPRASGPAGGARALPPRALLQPADAGPPRVEPSAALATPRRVQVEKPGQPTVTVADPRSLRRTRAARCTEPLAHGAGAPPRPPHPPLTRRAASSQREACPWCRCRSRRAHAATACVASLRRQGEGEREGEMRGGRSERRSMGRRDA